MAKYQNLQEEIKIDIDSGRINNDNAGINIILRNPRNEDFKFLLDRKRIIKVRDLRLEISKALKIDEDKMIKMFFRGRPLSDDSLVADSKLSDCDVILYMVSEAPKAEENEISILTQNSDLQNSDGEDHPEPNPNLHRGFNRFRDFGVDPSEIHILRILFHTAHLAHSRENIDNLSWQPEAVLAREEEWLNSNNPTFINSRNSMGNAFSPFGFYILRRNQRVNPFQNSIRNRLTQNNRDFARFIEPDSRFFLGIVCGMLLNIFTIIFLMFCTFKPKFRTGLRLGMVIGVIFFFLFYSN